MCQSGLPSFHKSTKAITRSTVNERARSSSRRARLQSQRESVTLPFAGGFRPCRFPMSVRLPRSQRLLTGKRSVQSPSLSTLQQTTLCYALAYTETQLQPSTLRRSVIQPDTTTFIFANTPGVNAMPVLAHYADLVDSPLPNGQVWAVLIRPKPGTECEQAKVELYAVPVSLPHHAWTTSEVSRRVGFTLQLTQWQHR